MPTVSPKTTPYYGGGQVQSPANVIQTIGTPSSKDISQSIGTLAVDNASGTIYALASKVNGIAKWIILGGTGSTTAPFQGTATLVAGTVTVPTAAVASGSRIMLSVKTIGGTVGTLSVGTIVAGTSFVINSSSSTDTSTINWQIIS